ncbi:MAG: hydroxyneurosporene dehydrogenase [Thermoplasmata archaeon]
MRATPLARLADRDADYARLGLERGHVQPWEDGMRTSGESGSYEWWYFDSHLEDGSSLVVTFYTKWMLQPKGPEAPMVQVDLDRPGKPTQHVIIHATPEQFSATPERCDVRVKECYFRGDLHTYQIKVVDDNLTIEAELVGQVPSWRPATGVTYFGARDEHTFAWMPAVPQGKVTVTLTEKNSAPETLTGIGYHDHNWGDVVMSKLLNHWYWGRAQAGPYSVIAAYLYAEKEYGRTELPQIMIAKDGRIVADQASQVRLVLEDVATDSKSQKPVANRVIYDYTQDERVRYRVIFQRSQTILDYKLADTVTGFKHVLARMARVDGAYLRFSGSVTVEKYEEGTRVEQVSDPGIWELMYLGHVE